MVRRKSEGKYRGKVIDKNRISIPCSFEPHISNYRNREVYTLSSRKRLLVMAPKVLKKCLDNFANSLDDLTTAHTRINPAFFSTERSDIRFNLSPIALREAGLGFGDYVNIFNKRDYIEMRKFVIHGEL